MVARPRARLRAGPHVYPRGSDRRPAPRGSGGKRPVREGAGAGARRGPGGPGGAQRQGRAVRGAGPLRPQRVPRARRSPRRAGGPASEDVREPAAGGARRHQLPAARPDLSIVPVRGNVQTRLARATGATVVRSGVESRPAEGDPRGLLDGVVLALAGLRRLGLESQVTEVLALELSLPAAGQGALAIEAVRGSPGHAATAPLDDKATALCVRAERAVLARLSGGCTVPVAAYALLEGEQLWLRALPGGPDGRGGVEMVRAERRGPTLDPESLGQSVGEALLDAGGGMLLEAARSQAQGLPAPKRA